MRWAFIIALNACVLACGSSDDTTGTKTGTGGHAGASGTGATGGSHPDASSGGSAATTTGGAAGAGGNAGIIQDSGTGGIAGNAGSAGAAGTIGVAGAAGASNKTYRNSLSICWTDATCPRVFAVAHGGMWNVTGPPYDSNGALAAAYAGDVDGVKIDVRVTMDDVPVISHSSPLEIYESIDCYGKKIEEMTAAEVTSCHRFPSTTETFQRLDDVLNYIRDKMVVQLTVKLTTDYARTIQEVHTQAAEDFAFLEISTADLQNLIPTIPGADSVYYLISIGNLTEVDALIDTIKNPRAFMYEFDPSVDVSTLTPNRLHPANVRSFTYTNAAAPGEPELQALFEGGYDVVSSQAAANGVLARKAVNQSRGVSPP